MYILQIIVAIILCCYSTESARILGVFPFAAHSHYTLGFILMQGLAEKGHDVTMISPYPQKKPLKNLRDIDLPGFIEAMDETRKTLFNEEQLPFIESEILFYDFMISLTNNFFKVKGVEDLLKSNEKFDLVIVEDCAIYAMYGFCYRFNAPCISSTSIGLSRLSHAQVGNPYSPAYMPDYALSYGANMNFFERAYNTFAYSFLSLYTHFYAFPEHNKILHKYFPGSPDVTDLHYNISLMLANGHVSTNPAVPYVPNMIDIGGFHVRPPKKLREDLQKFLDNAKEGAILFSLGSSVKSSALPKEKQEAILKALSKLKQKVLWKWEDTELPGKPANVKIEKWLPQTDVLAHPNIKLFITHGGLLSTIETIYHGVPVVGIPFFGDQKLNMANTVNSGFGLQVPYATLNEENFYNTIQEVLTNPKYTETAKRRSRIMHDQPMKPLDKAIFWTEYVLRHKGATHLRSAALNLAWYQYLLLDVLLVVALTTFVAIASFYFTIKFACCRKKANKVTNIKKRN